MEVEPANLQSQLHRLAERVRTMEEQYFDQNETNKFVVDEIILVHRECYIEHNVETSHIECKIKIDYRCHFSTYGCIREPG